MCKFFNGEHTVAYIAVAPLNIIHEKLGHSLAHENWVRNSPVGLDLTELARNV